MFVMVEMDCKNVALRQSVKKQPSKINKHMPL